MIVSPLSFDVFRLAIPSNLLAYPLLIWSGLILSVVITSPNFEKFSFSTHAGHKEITDFIYACDPNDVVIYHSDPNDARPHLVKELEQNGITPHSPENGQSYIIE